ncbi:GMC oxidoreductase, partial [Chromobacterium haemolyticum]
LRGVKLARRILRAPSMRRLIAEELLPSPAEHADDARLEQHIRQFAKTVYHPAGTCRMGGDADAVVDPRLRVKGVTGLRVCDASVMPSIVSGNTNAPVVMIAERCAEFMLSGQ